MDAPILILLRHAHRDTDRGRQHDNGLSKKGKRQALAARKFFRKRFGKDADVALLSSPKKRCLETLEPLSDALGVDIEVNSLLDEQQRGESRAKFEQRVVKACSRYKKGKAHITVLCTHGDWVPTACRKLTGLAVGVNKGGWMEFCGRTTLKLDWICQKLD